MFFLFKVLEKRKGTLLAGLRAICVRIFIKSRGNNFMLIYKYYIIEVLDFFLTY